MGMAQDTVRRGPFRTLAIENFRRFKHLTIPRLGDVNLLVGRNSSGKSSVLEAIRILASDGAPEVFRDICRAREEGFADATKPDLVALSGLCRRGADAGGGFRISAGEDFVSVTPGLYWRSQDAAGFLRFAPVSADAIDFAEVGLAVESPRRRHILDENGLSTSPRYGGVSQKRPEASCVFVGTEGVSRQRIGSLWQGVALTDMEDRLNRLMRESFPEIERVSVVPGERESSCVAKVRGAERPVPLRSLGEGAMRFFGLALSAVAARNGVLLIDEVEIGIHYSVQVEMWRLLVNLAMDLQVQIFATTHSEDAIGAFSIATKDVEAVNGCLIRLQSRGGEIEAVEYSEGELWASRDAAAELR